jgi:hypothetical protein
MKVGVDLDIDGTIVIVADDRGGRSPPTIVDKVRLIGKVVERIARVTAGLDEYMYAKRDALVFSIPVELHMVLRWTIGSEVSMMSVLDVIAHAAGIKPSQIVAEYPPAERAEPVIKQAQEAAISWRARAHQLDAQVTALILRCLAAESEIEAMRDDEAAEDEPR